MPTNVLSLLTRLRQLTLHPGLLPPDYLNQLRCCVDDSDGNPTPAIQITPKDRIRLQALLLRGIEDCEECPICFDVRKLLIVSRKHRQFTRDIASDPRITPCAHIFCLLCISEVIARDPRCPMVSQRWDRLFGLQRSWQQDRSAISTGDLVQPPPPTDLTQAAPELAEDTDDATGIRVGSSAKTDQLVHLLQLTPKTEKSLVFSQFTGFLDKVISLQYYIVIALLTDLVADC